jgi:hypothetical protein
MLVVVWGLGVLRRVSGEYPVGLWRDCLRVSGNGPGGWRWVRGARGWPFWGVNLGWGDQPRLRHTAKEQGRGAAWPLQDLICAQMFRAHDGFLPSRPDAVLGMPPGRRRRHSYQPRAFALGSSPQTRFPALKARLILPAHQEQPLLGWYKAGRWPESNGVSPKPDQRLLTSSPTMI